MTRTVTIRPCDERDLAYFGRFGSPAHVQFCQAEFRRPEVVILVATDEDDLPVGKAHLEVSPREGIGKVIAVAVAPELQRQGIGTELMHACEQLARRRHLQRLRVEVADENPDARRLYERLGYEIVGSVDIRYRGAPVPNPGVLMEKGLAW